MESPNPPNEKGLSSLNGNEVEEAIRAKVDSIFKAHNFKYDYRVMIHATHQMLAENDDVVIVSGNPPTIIFSLRFILEVLAMQMDEEKYSRQVLGRAILRDRIERAMERIPKLTRTLTNLVPYDSAVALRKEMKTWRHTAAPDFVYGLPDKYFEVTYSIKVKEVISGAELEHVDIPEKKVATVVEAIKTRLGRMVLATESYEDLVEMLAEYNHIKDKEIIPAAVHIQSDGEGNVNTKMEY